MESQFGKKRLRKAPVRHYSTQERDIPLRLYCMHCWRLESKEIVSAALPLWTVGKMRLCNLYGGHFWPTPVLASWQHDPRNILRRSIGSWISQ